MQKVFESSDLTANTQQYMMDMLLPKSYQRFKLYETNPHRSVARYSTANVLERIFRRRMAELRERA